MTSIQSTIDNALPSGAQEAYPHAYQTVLDALLKREYDLAEAIITAAVQHTDYSRDEVERVAVGLGLEVRPAPPVVVPIPAPAPPVVVTIPAHPWAVSPEAEGSPEAEDSPEPSESPKEEDDTHRMLRKLAKQVKKLTKAARREGIQL